MNGECGLPGAILSPSWNAVIVDLAPGCLPGAIAVVRAARSRRPCSLVLGAATITRELDSVLKLATSAGVTDTVLVDVEDAVSLIRAHLRTDSGNGARASAIRCIGRTVPAEHYAVACAVIDNAAVCTSVDCLARVVASSRWALDRTFARCALTASEFMDYCRIVLAAAFIEYSGWTVDRIGKAVGFRDPRAFRGACVRLTGRLPSELKAGGATEDAGRAVASFLAVRAGRPRVVKERAVPWLSRK